MTKLCPRGKAAAKRKFKVYPSAYANAYASKICAGKIKDPSGVKRKDFRGPKPAATGGMMKNDKKNKQADPAKLIQKRKDSKKEALEKIRKELGMPTSKAVGGVIGRQVIKRANKKINKIIKAGPPFKKLTGIAAAATVPVGRMLKKYEDKVNAKKRDKAKVQKKMMGGMTAGSRSALGRIQKANMVEARMGKAVDYQKYLKGLKKATTKTNKASKYMSSADEFLKRRKQLGGRAMAAAKATRIGKIAAGVAALGLAGKAALEKAYEKRTGKKPLTKRRKLVDKKSQGGESKANVPESEMQVRSGREKAKKVKKKLKNIKNQVKGFGKEMLGFKKGGLKAELNNPAKGYTKGGMADYYKDLM